MLKLMKYEFKKTLFSKYVLLVFTAIMEVLFLIGVSLKKENVIGWGVAGLVVCALVGLFYIGIESIVVMHQDLNTKQSYMLFFTPSSTYQILASKILQNGLSIFLVGAAFGLLAIADFSYMVVRMEGLQMFLDLINTVLKQMQMDIHITKVEGFLALFSGLSSWLSMIVNAYLAIVLSATFLAGKKITGIVSFMIYVALVLLEGKLLTLLPDFSTITMNMGAVIGTNFILIILAYLLTGWIMDKKLSV